MVVARRGAGAYAADLPLPEEQRVAVQGDVVAAASQALDDTLATLARTPELQRPLVTAIDRRPVLAKCRNNLNAKTPFPLARSSTMSSSVIDA